MRTKSPWWIVFGSALGLIVGNGPIMQFTFGVLLKPISEEFRWDRATVSSAIVIGLCMTGVITPVVGAAVDRWGVRPIALPSIILFSLAVASVSLVPDSVPLFIALYAVMGIFAAGQTPLIYAKSISANFDARRGLALGIAMAGVGLGAALVPQFAQAITTNFGWRAAYVGLGLLTFALAFPAVALFLREPGPTTASAISHAVELVGLTGREAIQTWRFWILAFAFFVVAAAANGTIAHVIPLLTDRGVSPQMATSALSTAGVALIMGRLVAGYLLDRIFAPYVALVFFLLPLAGILTLSSTDNTTMAALATVLIGMGLGAEVDLIAFLISRYFGMRSFGQIYGYLFAIFMLANGIGPFLMGLSFDKVGSYNTCLIGFAIGLVFASAVILKLGPYPYPVRHADGARPDLAPAH
jgi:MFS family permease